ncbi:hypothetical protein [Sulfurimonas sp.]|uniref:hypothetical protein n=1 Tax=Sulfurimonas sp. TaxID=2022749 RepID=UPI0028D6D079|nr:hypothetical protein [Sulfurimonas sp.]
MLPTKIAKAKVFSIHGSDSKELKRENIFSNEAKNEKSFKTKTPRTTPPKRDNITLRV